MQLPVQILIKIIAFLKTFGKTIRVRDLGQVEGGRTGRLPSAPILSRLVLPAQSYKA